MLLLGDILVIESLPSLLLLVVLLIKLFFMLGDVFLFYLLLSILVCLLYLHGVLAVLLGEVEGCLVISLQYLQFLVALLLQGQFLLRLPLLHHLCQGILISLLGCHLLVEMRLFCLALVVQLFILE